MQKIGKQAYRENLRQLGLLLEGKYKQLLKQLKDKMFQAAGIDSFEEAAMLRDRINSLSEIIAQTRETKLAFEFSQGRSRGGEHIEPKDLIWELKI